MALKAFIMAQPLAYWLTEPSHSVTNLDQFYFQYLEFD
jgi:hypothetical protein